MGGLAEVTPAIEASAPGYNGNILFSKQDFPKFDRRQNYPRFKKLWRDSDSNRVRSKPAIINYTKIRLPKVY